MPTVENAFDRARSLQARVVFPEADDPRIATAMDRLRAEGLAVPVPLAKASEAHLAAIQSVRPMKEPLARRMAAKPLIRAAAMVTAGEADVMVAGVVNSTRRVIEAASIGIGLAEGVSVPSSCFLMVFPDGREFVFADCGVNVAPNATELGDIAIATARTARNFFGHSEVAMLSFSTLTSGAGDSVELVRAATEIVTRAGVTVIGPVQGDAALNAGIAAQKGLDGGTANTLIFPSLDAGNIAYKLLQELAGAQASGPLLQGFRKPVSDLSRGASVDDIVATTVLTIAMEDTSASD